MNHAPDMKVHVKGVMPTQNGCGIFLHHPKADKIISIFVDPGVALAITLMYHGIRKPRPLTHDLLGNILAGLDVRLEKVVVHDLRDDIFYARLFLVQSSELGTKVIEVDSRPSDAIALALRQKCQIFVSSDVWNRADDMTWAYEEAQKQSDEDIPGA